MPNVGELTTLITAHTAPFEKATKRASTKTRQFAREVETTSTKSLSKLQGGLSTAVSGFAGPLGLTIGVGAAIGAVKRFSRAILEEGQALDAVGKLAERTNIASRDLMALQFAAGQSGVTTEQLTMALQAFQKRTGEAAKGSGEAAKAFEQLGINAEEFSKLPAIERFKLMADRLGNIADETQKSQLAAKLFSDVGKGPMLNMLNLGADGIDRLTQAAKDLGATLSDETIDAIERTNDALAKQELRMKGLWQQLTGELLPSVGYLTERWDELLNTLGKDPDSTLVRGFLEGGLQVMRGTGLKGKAGAYLGSSFLTGGDILKQEELTKRLNAQFEERGLSPEDMPVMADKESKTLQKQQIQQQKGSNGLLKGILNGVKKTRIVPVPIPVVERF
jgi:hypothetical protein